MILRRIVVSLILTAVSFSSMGVQLSAMWGPGQKWQRTRQDDELIAVAMASKVPAVGVVYLAKDPDETSALLSKLRALGGATHHVDRKIGYIRAIVPTANIYRALDVPSGDVAAVDEDFDFFLPTGGSEGPQATPPPNEERTLREINSAVTKRFLRASSPILHDLGADVWRKQHPTFDGRGIVIADVEDFVDPLVPELSGALTLSGRPIRKIARLRLIVDPGDRTPTGDNSLQWVDMHAQLNGSGSVVYKGHTYDLPHPGNFRIGLFNLFAIAKSVTHWLNPLVFGGVVGNGIFPVLWEPSTGLVWVDKTRTEDFRHVKPMRDYNISGDWSYFGSLAYSKTYPLLRPAVSYVVLVNKPFSAVAIGLGGGTHAVGVTVSAAGHPVGPNDPVHGVAPAAQVASYEYTCSKLHSQAEALIAAAEDPITDIIVYEWCNSFNTTNEQGWFLSALVERLVRAFNKPIFVGGLSHRSSARGP